MISTEDECTAHDRGANAKGHPSTRADTRGRIDPGRARWRGLRRAPKLRSAADKSHAFSKSSSAAPSPPTTRTPLDARPDTTLTFRRDLDQLIGNRRLEYDIDAAADLVIGQLLRQIDASDPTAAPWVAQVIVWRGTNSTTRFDVQRCMLICMHSTSVRIDVATHEDLKRLAIELNTTVGNTVSLAVRALRQDRIGGDLRTAMRDDEVAWLDADLG